VSIDALLEASVTDPEEDVSSHKSLIMQPQWPTLAEEAFFGLPGDVAKQLNPFTEADPIATLAHTLTAFGNLIGDGPHVPVQNDRHPARLYTVLIGDTGKGRKGTSLSAPRELLRAIDLEWASNRIRTGLSSGEGLIYHVRDGDGDKDAGEQDKRLLSVEAEFSAMLRIMARDGNSLSGVIRQAWDHGDLSTLTRNNPLTASGAHFSLIGHTTKEELIRSLDETSMANGFGNRILWFLVKRSKLLPDGADVPIDIMNQLAARLKAAARFAKECTRVARDPEAAELWRRVYGPLSEGRPGLSGALCNRAEAQAVRLSLAYAVMDSSPAIRIEHLKAALALWEYAERSVRYVFGDRTGNPVADRIMEALRDHPDGMTTEEIRDLFSRHRTAEKDGALEMLLRLGRIVREKLPTGGRPTTIYRVAT